MKDPYLIEGQPCEIINTTYTENNQRMLYYFWGYTGKDDPIFVMHHAQISKKLDRVCYFSTDNYRPIGTEWDFAPVWAVYSTIDKNGTIRFWSGDKPCWGIIGQWIGIEGDVHEDTGFICPDKSRFTSDAWKTSIRMKPAWAEEKE